MVDGKAFYGHKIIISQLSEKFKAMFSMSSHTPYAGQMGGFIESKQNVIKIPDISYPVFS